jgi:hypothetical protein
MQMKAILCIADTESELDWNRFKGSSWGGVLKLQLIHRADYGYIIEKNMYS